LFTTGLYRSVKRFKSKGFKPFFTPIQYGAIW